MGLGGGNLQCRLPGQGSGLHGFRVIVGTIYIYIIYIYIYIIYIYINILILILILRAPKKAQGHFVRFLY